MFSPGPTTTTSIPAETIQPSTTSTIYATPTTSPQFTSTSLSLDQFKNRCFELKEYRERQVCFRRLGINVDPECETIQEDSARLNCYHYQAKIKLNASEVCGVFSGDDYYLCYEDVAVIQYNPNLCEELPDLRSRYRCLSYLGIGLADRSICERIPSEGVFSRPAFTSVEYNTLRQLCLIGVLANAPKEQKTSALCDEITDPDLNAYCLAVVLGDDSYCSNLSGFRRFKCEDTVKNNCINPDSDLRYIMFEKGGPRCLLIPNWVVYNDTFIIW
ncbi:MAG: hypothetical protein NTU61_04700 [Candidatus Altiarchaeota archaeon]|nr:hypothetical protein [Candidatus Altiarchaeota archaeon]